MGDYWRFRWDREDAADGCQLFAHARSTDRWHCSICGLLVPARETHCPECGQVRRDYDGEVTQP